MPTVSIDHIAIPTANAEQLMAFYKRLGFPINNERRGVPVPCQRSPSR